MTDKYYISFLSEKTSNSKNLVQKTSHLRCERTAKINDLFQSCKYFFKNVAFSESRPSAKLFRLLYCKLSNFARTAFFSNADAKVATIFEHANIFATFFAEKVENGLEQHPKRIIYLYVKGLPMHRTSSPHSDGPYPRPVLPIRLLFLTLEKAASDPE